MTLTLTAADSPIPNVLDMYFDFIRQLAGPTGSDKLALNSTIVTFDVIKDAPLYTENVFRGFADRKIIASPSEYGFGSASMGDRYSFLYKVVLEGIVSRIDRSLDAEDREEIRGYKRELRDTEGELEEAFVQMQERWDAQALRLGLTPEDPRYLEEQVAFYNSFGFATKVRRMRREISLSHEDIRNVRLRAYPDQEAQMLSYFNMKAQMAENDMARPQSPILEAERNYTYAEMSRMWVFGNLGAAFDSSVEVFPSGHLPFFIDREGARGVTMKEGLETEHTHTQEWSASGTGRYKFFSISSSVEMERRLEESLSQAVSISITFENMSEYFVRRGDWYSSSVFDMERFQDYLKDYPQNAVDLSHIITSLILGRGLELTFTFNTVESLQVWEELDIENDFSLNIFGFKIPAGEADYESKEMNKRVDTATKTVHFKDDSDHCRVLAFRVEKVIDVPNELYNLRTMDWEDTISPALQRVSDGDTTYSDVICEIERQERDLITRRQSNTSLSK